MRVLSLFSVIWLVLFDTLQLALAANFTNANTAPYLVGSLPDFDFGLGASYSGLLPISDKANEARKLFFWFFPTSNRAGSNELTIWFSGGPGCSGLIGLVTENGPFVWYPGSAAPSINPWSIRHLTNVLYVDSPIGTGYSAGTADITNEQDLAQEFMGFYKNFADLFETKDQKLYIAGESYGGFYASYIADAFLNASFEYSLAGVSLTSPLIGSEFQQQQVHAVPFALKWRDIMLLNDTTVSNLEKFHTFCGYSDFIDKWFRFPGVQKPMPSLDSTSWADCNIWDTIAEAALDANPCWDVYHIPSFCPFASTAIINPAAPDAVVPGNVNFFDRPDVKAALHVPTDTSFVGCGRGVYFDNDEDLTIDNPPSVDGTLGRVIDKVGNVMIGTGQFDFSLTFNDTLLAIQNMTWGGKRGFDKYPANKFVVPRVSCLENTLAQAQAGEVGTWVCERGLTYFTVKGSGHEIWADSPAATFRAYEVFLGRRSNLSSSEGFTADIWGTS